jgi:UDP-N-acetylmuramoyl-tripeptide--D-alanyl-D-alanine ligase
MNAPGEIAPLARMAQPDVAVVTTVAPAHLEAFGVIEGIAHEKASIYDGLSPGGVALAHADVDTAPILFDKARAVGARLVRFGEAEDAGHPPDRPAQCPTPGPSARAVLGGTSMVFRLPCRAQHNAMNGLIALAACDALGADVAEAAMALAAWEPVSGRGTRETAGPGRRGRSGDRPHRRRVQRQPRLAAAGLDVLATIDPPRGRAARGDPGRHAGAGRSAAIHAEVADDAPWPRSTSCTPPAR